MTNVRHKCAGHRSDANATQTQSNSSNLATFSYIRPKQTDHSRRSMPATYSVPACRTWLDNRYRTGCTGYKTLSLIHLSTTHMCITFHSPIRLRTIVSIDASRDASAMSLMSYPLALFLSFSVSLLRLSAAQHVVSSTRCCVAFSQWDQCGAKCRPYAT